MADETSAQVAEAIAELTEQAQNNAALQGDTDKMVGASQQLKQKSMVRSGNTVLPERVRFYRSQGGAEAWLPTAQLGHHLAKRHADGTAVFVKERTGPVPVPIDETCAVCARKGNAKKFYHEYDYVAHMESKHPREYRIIQSKAKAVTGGDVAAALMNMNPQERSAIRVLLGGEDGNSETLESAKCDACGWEGQPVKSVSASLGAHKRFRCTAREAVASGSGA